MATVVCAVVDTEDATLDLACAGHLPPLLVDGRGGAQPVEPDGDSFTMRARVDDAGVELCVHDAGRWRPRRDTNRGHGLVLMRALADEVDLTTASHGTEVAMRWHRGRAPT